MGHQCSCMTALSRRSLSSSSHLAFLPSSFCKAVGQDGSIAPQALPSSLGSSSQILALQSSASAHTVPVYSMCSPQLYQHVILHRRFSVPTAEPGNNSVCTVPTLIPLESRAHAPFPTFSNQHCPWPSLGQVQDQSAGPRLRGNEVSKGWLDTVARRDCAPGLPLPSAGFPRSRFSLP